MKCNNIFYLKDSTIILKRKNKFYQKEISRDILNHGIVYQIEELENQIIKIFKANKLSTFFYNQSSQIIYTDYNIDNNYSNIKKVFSDLNFNIKVIIKDSEVINISDDNCYLFCSRNICRLYYKDRFKIKKSLIIDLNNVSTLELKLLILNRCKHKELYLVDDNHSLLKVIKELGIKYYVYNDKNFIINSIPDM